MNEWIMLNHTSLRFSGALICNSCPEKEKDVDHIKSYHVFFIYSWNMLDSND